MYIKIICFSYMWLGGRQWRLCTRRVSALSEVRVMMRAFILTTVGSDKSKKLLGREDQSSRLTGDWYKRVRVSSWQSSVDVHLSEDLWEQGGSGKDNSRSWGELKGRAIFPLSKFTFFFLFLEEWCSRLMYLVWDFFFSGLFSFFFPFFCLIFPASTEAASLPSHFIQAAGQD